MHDRLFCCHYSFLGVSCLLLLFIFFHSRLSRRLLTSHVLLWKKATNTWHNRLVTKPPLTVDLPPPAGICSPNMQSLLHLSLFITNLVRISMNVRGHHLNGLLQTQYLYLCPLSVFLSFALFCIFACLVFGFIQQ